MPGPATPCTPRWSYTTALKLRTGKRGVGKKPEASVRDGACRWGRVRRAEHRTHERSRRTGVPARRARALASSREGAGRNPSTCRRHQTRENGHTRRRGRLGVVQGAAGGREGSPGFPAEAATAAMAPQSCGAGRGDLGVRKSFPNWGELGLPGEHE